MSLFGAKPATSAAPSTGFGFGAAASTASPAKPLFGSTTVSSTPSLFGSTAPATSTTGSLFGSTATSTAAGGGLFGKPAASVAPTTGGLFASTASSTGGLFGSTTTSTSGGLFGKPSTGFGTSTTTTSGGLFGTKPVGGGLFNTTTSQAAAPATRQRETLHGLISNADATVRSLTCPELYGDERDQIVGKLNQVAAALGVGNGFYKDGQSVSYPTEGPFHRLKAVGYNSVSEYSDSDGIVTLTMKSTLSELVLFIGSCPNGYQCKFSAIRKDYYCCSKQTKKTPASYHKNGGGCARGSVLLYPSTQEPVLCKPDIKGCPSGYLCLPHTSSKVHQCCSVEAVRDPRRKEKEIHNIDDVEITCPSYMFKMEKGTNGNKTSICVRKCPDSFSSVGGICRQKV